MPHWTYESRADTPDLEQGDILVPTPRMKRLFAAVHPHFCDSKYIAFVVLTQSCDLVRRKQGKCKSQYVTLAVVRDLAALLEGFLDLECNKIAPRVYSKDTKVLARQFLKRVLHQNEQSLGLFYLHPDELTAIAHPSIILLRVSVAVRAEEHYETLLSARRAGLAPEFKDKLGWLAGNLYSRIGTKDWADFTDGERACQELEERLLDDERFFWVDERSARLAQKKHPELSSRTTGEALRLIDESKPTPVDEQMLTAAGRECESIVATFIQRLKAFSAADQERNRTLLDFVERESQQLPSKLVNRLRNTSEVSRLRKL